MDIITRQEAREKGLKTYYTGSLCKNQHDSYRYTQSGTCAQCIKSSNGGQVDDATLARKHARFLLVKVRLRCYEQDRDTLAASVWSFAMMREPTLTLSDVDPRTLPTDVSGPVGLYSFNCHSEDVPAIREVAEGMLRTHALVDFSKVRRNLFTEVAKNLPADSTPPMNFK